MGKSAITAGVRRTARMWRFLYSKWFGGAVFLCLVVGIVWWFVTQERLPGNIRIATGAKNGQYYLFGETLGASIKDRIGKSTTVLVTEGSVDNLSRLTDEEAEADLAIVQHGAVPMAELAAIAPLWEEVVHVVVRKGRGIESIHDLAGKSVVLGPMGSGMRTSALEVLDHYGVNPDELGEKSESYFMELEADQSLDAAIVTTGYVNTDLKQLLADGAFELVAIEDAEALSIRYSHLAPATIPRSLYREGPAVPAQPIQTVKTTAIIVANSDVPAPLVDETVAALYEGYLLSDGGDTKRQLAQLMTASDARKWAKLPLHPVTQAYFEPYKGLVLLKDFMESIVATKDLLFTVGAGVYVLWLWRRKVISRRDEAELAIHMRRLNALLDETIRIETEQMKTDDPAKLREYLDEITRIKLRALDELTNEDLRGDQMFAIFLTQCSNVGRKMQLKIGVPFKSQT